MIIKGTAVEPGGFFRKQRSASVRRAFTLVELLVVIGVVAILAAQLLPALARAKSRSANTYCMNNKKQLTAAVQMYAPDFGGWFPLNPDDGGTTPPWQWCGGNVAGPDPNNGMTGAQTFNTDYLTNASIVPVGPYLGFNVSALQCPADPRQGPYSGSQPALFGTIVRATRSVSMTSSVGSEDTGFANGSGHAGPTTYTSGAWLDGTQHGNRHNAPYATFSKMSDFGRVSASQIFMMADESPYSINDANFGFCVDLADPKIVDWPATYHVNACGFGFCDGHAEIHQWASTNLVLNGSPSTQSVGAATPFYKDWTWLATHISLKVH